MNIKTVLRHTGFLLMIEGAFMLPSLIIALFCKESSSAFAFCVTIAGLLLIGFLFSRIRSQSNVFYAREGFFTVALSWVLMSLFGALPFFISGEIPSFIDSFFETVSGFTTTGASILSEVEPLSYSILYWRSFTHWLGGMGVLVFLLAVVPLAAGSGMPMHLLKAESPGPVTGKLVPNTGRTARILYSIYIAMTIAEIIFLLFGGMSLFDAVTTSFGTAGTGGFSVRNLSIAAYDSAYIDIVVTVFMILFGVNFNIYFLLLCREFVPALRNQELRVYLGIILFSTAAISINILPQYGNVGQSVLHASFQVASIITTTGFFTADFNLWPEFSKMLLVILMFIGACAGSTGGGLKVSRVIILFKASFNELRRLIHPKNVKLLRMNGKTVSDDVVRSVCVFFSCYIFLFTASLFLVSLDGHDFSTTFTAVASSMNNVGPGISLVGPICNFGFFSPFAKLILSFDMLLGRLEIFPMLILFSPSSFRRSK